MAEIRFDKTTRQFPRSDRAAVNALELEVADREFLVLVGPSGCGKTTSLRMLAGLEHVDAGTIYLGGEDVTDLPSRDRDIAMVFQSYALYPHMTVADNMGFALKIAGVKKPDRDRRVAAAAALLDLSDLLGRRPSALSGGQRQRVAMGRAIVREPQAFLMDEPLSNLDAQLRVQTRAEIHKLQRELGVTTIYVTHDQIEAMTMGDRVAVMRDGDLQQVDTPENVYTYPANRFVAGFIGSPSMNLVQGKIVRSDGSLIAEFGQHSLAIDESVVRSRPALLSHKDRTVVIGVRPEDIEDARFAPDAPATRRIHTKCEIKEALGSDVLIHFTVDARSGAAPSDREDHPIGGTTTTACVARLNPRTSVAEGEPIELAVDTSRLHFFDIETGLALDGKGR